jgi:predicted amidohydrolase YtcJ
VITPDVVLKNATIHTMNPAQPTATWLAVLGGDIVAVGSGVDAPPAKKVIDLGGATVVPGFHDAHCHTVWFGLSLAELDCTRFDTLHALYKALAKASESVAAGEWVLATGFNQKRCGGQYPDIEKLDSALPHHPLFMRHTSGHAAIVNTLALERSDVMARMSGVDGGAVVVDSSGRPTGLLEETAQILIQQLLLPKSEAELVAAIDRASRVYASEGITSFSDTGIAGGWIGHSPREFSAYQVARDRGVLRQRAQLLPVSDVLQTLPGHATDPAVIGLGAGIRTGLGDEWFSVGPMKIFLDGSMLAWTGAVSEPFAAGPADNYGYFQAEESVLRERMLQAAAGGWSIAAHAIGDRAVSLALDTFEEAVRLYGKPHIPHRIEHGGVVTDEQVGQAARLGVAIVTQPGFMPTLGVQMREAMGPKREAFLHRHKSLLDAGVLAGGSSDRPVATGTPLEVMSSMVLRQDAEDYVVAPQERVSVFEALWSYTQGSAQVTGVSHRRGSLEPGKVADFVVLDKDPLTNPPESLPDIQVMETWAGGAKVLLT